MKKRIICAFLPALFAGFTVFSQNQTIEDNRICMDPIVGSGTFINPTNTGLCVGCTAVDGANIVNGNLADYATLITGISVLGGGSSVSVKDTSQYYPGGNVVGFVISAQGGLLSATALGGLQIRTFRNGVLVETATSGGLLSASILGGVNNDKQMLSFTTTQAFDEVQLFAGSGLSLLTGIRVYYAFEGPASCALQCEVPLTTGYTASANGTGIIIPCPDPASPGNLTDPTLTNATNITIGLGLACVKWVQVANDGSVIPAGTEVGFVVSNGALLSASVLGGVSIVTYNASGVAQDNSASGVLLSATLLSGTADTYRISIKTTKSFTRARLVVNGGLLSANVNMNVYYAYTVTDTDNDGMPDCMDKCPGGNDLLDADGDGMPNSCDNNQTDVSIHKATTAPSPVTFNTDVTFTVSLVNHSTVNPTFIKVRDLLPAGLTYQSHTAPTGTNYNSTTGIWNVGSALQHSGLPNDSLVLTIVAKATARGVLVNSATIHSMFETNLNFGTSSGACITVPEELCEGSTMTLHAQPGLTSYQWYRNGSIIVGATDSVYVASQGGSYTCNFTSSSSCATGDCCPVIVNMLTRPLASNTGVPACSGSTVNLTSSTSTAGDTYLWNTGETTASISITASVTANYLVTKTGTNGCFNTDTIAVTVSNGPTIAGAITLCNNNGTVDDATDDTFTFTLNPGGGGGGGSTYSVSGSGITTVAGLAYGSTSAAFGPFAISGGNRTITLTDSNGCGLADTIVTAPLSCSTCLPVICVPITITKN